MWANVSFALLIILLVAVAVFIRYLKPKLGALAWKLSGIACGLYLLVLLLLVPIVNWLSLNGFAVQVDNPGKAYTSLNNDWHDLAKAIAQGKQNDLQGVYKNSQQTFHYNGKTLSFKLDNVSSYNQIIIDRKEADDDQIEIATYVAPQFVQGVDFTQRILPPLISLEMGTLYIKSEVQDLSYKNFQADFTLSQFKPNELKNRNDSFGMVMGWKAVYIRIPQSMVIDEGKNNAMILYLNGSDPTDGSSSLEQE